MKCLQPQYCRGRGEKEGKKGCTWRGHKMLTTLFSCGIMSSSRIKKEGEREMPHFSERSLERLDTCSPLLQEIAHQAIRVVDFSVVWGHRTKVAQDKFFSEGYSKVEWPRSKHNRWPARAFDLAPWPINWDNRERFFFLAGVILSIARNKEVGVVWGGAWKGQFNQPGEFDDLAHYELLD